MLPLLSLSLSADDERTSFIDDCACSKVVERGLDIFCGDGTFKCSSPEEEISNKSACRGRLGDGRFSLPAEGLTANVSFFVVDGGLGSGDHIALVAFGFWGDSSCIESV